MSLKITERQQEILDWLKSYIRDNRYPPTLREIGTQFEIASTQGVKRHLDALERKGKIRCENNASRGIVVIEDAVEVENATTMQPTINNSRTIPVLGRVAAGSPIMAEGNIEGTISIDSGFVKANDFCFALKVKGDSMINAGIFEDDYVIVNSNASYNNYDIVVALVDNEATVKRFVKKDKLIQLLPDNDKYKPIIVNETNDLKIAGKVIGVIRWFN